nr:MAG TPA: hypothetical protein [Caudoviricetes sp.]
MFKSLTGDFHVRSELFFYSVQSPVAFFRFPMRG